MLGVGLLELAAGGAQPLDGGSPIANALISAAPEAALTVLDTLWPGRRNERRKWLIQPMGARGQFGRGLNAFAARRSLAAPGRGDLASLGVFSPPKKTRAPCRCGARRTARTWKPGLCHLNVLCPNHLACRATAGAAALLLGLAGACWAGCSLSDCSGPRPGVGEPCDRRNAIALLGHWPGPAAAAAPGGLAATTTCSDLPQARPATSGAGHKIPAPWRRGALRLSQRTDDGLCRMGSRCGRNRPGREGRGLSVTWSGPCARPRSGGRHTPTRPRPSLLPSPLRRMTAYPARPPAL